MIEIKIGDVFGLWKVIGEPSLSSKGKILTTSKYPCICSGCSKEGQVEKRYLILGKSKGCQSCRSSKTMKELRATGIGTHAVSIDNPQCPKCLINMVCTVVEKTKKATRKRYKCRDCGELLTKHFPLSEQNNG